MQIIVHKTVVHNNYRTRVFQQNTAQSITLPPPICLCPTVHAGANTSPGEWCTQTRPQPHIRQGFMHCVLWHITPFHWFILDEIAFIHFSYWWAMASPYFVGCLWFSPPWTTFIRYSPQMTMSTALGISGSAPTQESDNNNLGFVKLSEVYLLSFPFGEQDGQWLTVLCSRCL